MKIVALGTSKFLIYSVKGLIESGHEIIALISLPKSLLPVNSVDIEKEASDFKIPYLEITDINSKGSYEAIKKLKPDLMFSAWPKIIKENIIQLPKHGVIGTHPTALPNNRGRHPLHWEIVLGIKKSMLSYFRMDKDIDAGPILLQVPYKISSKDDIQTLDDRINGLALKHSKTLGAMLNDETVFPVGTMQDNNACNTWRKRTLFDVTLDFRMSGKDILALIRSFTKPFSHAMICVENNIVHVISGAKTSLELLPLNIENIEHGKVLHVEKKMLRIKTSDSVLDLITLERVDHLLSAGSYIHPPLKYLLNSSFLINIYSDKK
jgi:methionyl-tRNA formyltransferase